MQQRVPIEKFPEWIDAHKAKEKLQIQYPDVTYGIRRRKNGFVVFRRFSVNKISQYEEHYAKKRHGPSKRQRRRGLDPTFLSEVWEKAGTQN